MENSVVSVASFCHEEYPTSYVKRFSISQIKHIQVQRLSRTGGYNRFIGRTVRMDEKKMHTETQPGGQPPKIVVAIFISLIDITVYNAWLIPRKSDHVMRQLEFHRITAQAYNSRYRSPPINSWSY